MRKLSEQMMRNSRLSKQGANDIQNMPKLSPKTKEREMAIQGSLKERANRLMKDPEYLSKLEEIANGNPNKIRVMDFVL